MIRSAADVRLTDGLRLIRPKIQHGSRSPLIFSSGIILVGLVLTGLQLRKALRRLRELK